MYTYQYRLFDRYHVPVASIAVLIDHNKNWFPPTYQSNLWGTELNFKYEVLKVLSYETKKKLLKKSSNPFATIILAQLEAMALTKESNAEQHLISKLKLTRLLYEKGWGRDYVYSLYRFIDWIIQLPQDLVLQYDDAAHKIEEAKNMGYVTQTERLWMDKGKAEIVQNLYRALKDEKKVAELSKLSLRKVHAILGLSGKKRTK